jgi:hypothetical protein
MADYDDAALRFWTLTESTGNDFTPFDFLAVADKTLTCAVVPCPPFYSSVNYVFLGLIAQHLAGRAAWEDYDQLSVIPAARRYGALGCNATPDLNCCLVLFLFFCATHIGCSTSWPRD